MKRLACFLLLVITVGLLSSLLTINLKPGLEITDFLPADTIALIEGNNLARIGEVWQRSSLGRKLNNPDFPRILEQLGLPDSRIAEFSAVTLAANQFTGSSFFNKIFAKKTLVALLPGYQEETPGTAAVLRHLVLIVQLGSDASVHDQLEQFFGAVRSTRVATYQGIPLFMLTLQSGQVVTVCQHRSVLLCSLESQSVLRCIDQSLNRMVQARTGLQLNQEYQALKKRAGARADFFLYADLRALLRQLPAAQVAEMGGMGLMPHHFAVFHQDDAGHDRLSIIAQVGQEQLNAFTNKYQVPPPVAEAGGQRLTSETQLYFRTNWFNAKILWNLGLQTFGREAVELMSFIAQRIFENTGKTIDDILDVFGSRFGVFINEQQVVPQSTRSMTCLYVEVYDQTRVNVMLKQLLAGLQRVTVFSGGTEIVSVVMAGGLLSPAYALVDNYLILADSVGLIEQVQRQGGLAPVNADATLVPVRDTVSNVFLFVRTRSVAQRLIPMLAVLTRDTVDQPKMLSAKTRLLIEHTVIPLLTSLQNMESSSLRGYIAGNEMILDMDFTAGGEESRVF